jgi:hypothetical protein
MPALDNGIQKFPKIWRGEKNHRFFVARPKISVRRVKTTCSKCDRPVRRSSKTGTLWPNCYTCRLLMMVYGPNIKVKYNDDK